jgi:hypothetical protein
VCHRSGRLLRSAAEQTLSYGPARRQDVRFCEPYRPPRMRWGTLGIIVDVEERSIWLDANPGCGPGSVAYARQAS